MCRLIINGLKIEVIFNVSMRWFKIHGYHTYTDFNLNSFRIKVEKKRGKKPNLIGIKLTINLIVDELKSA